VNDAALTTEHLKKHGRTVYDPPLNDEVPEARLDRVCNCIWWRGRSPPDIQLRRETDLGAAREGILIIAWALVDPSTTHEMKKSKTSVHMNEI
jgi:hypothetical protein